jgi:hypothetical protein
MQNIPILMQCAKYVQDQSGMSKRDGSWRLAKQRVFPDKYLLYSTRSSLYNTFYNGIKLDVIAR